MRSYHRAAIGPHDHGRWKVAYEKLPEQRAQCTIASRAVVGSLIPGESALREMSTS